MKVIKTHFNGLLVIEPGVFTDQRGIFCELFSVKKYEEIGITCNFVQDNISVSKENVIRGLHYQIPPYAQAKLVSVLEGEILDIAVDIRKNSPTFGKYFSIILKSPLKNQLFIPEGYAHGFSVLSKKAIVHYKCSNFYSPAHERGILWNDSTIAIDWKVKLPIISHKDSNYPELSIQKDLF